MQKSHSRSPHRAVKRFGFYPVGYTKPFVKWKDQRINQATKPHTKTSLHSGWLLFSLLSYPVTPASHSLITQLAFFLSPYCMKSFPCFPFLNPTHPSRTTSNSILFCDTFHGNLTLQVFLTFPHYRNCSFLLMFSI
jgi:hypothetical protein